MTAGRGAEENDGLTIVQDSWTRGPSVTNEAKHERGGVAQ